MRIFILAAAAAGLMATPAAAQSHDGTGLYGSIGYGQIDGDSYEFGTITTRLGAKFTRFVGIEGEASFGLTEEEFDVSIGGNSGTIEHKYDAAAYAVGYLPVGDSFEVFARVGYGVSEVESSEASVGVTQDGESLNYGVGANYFLTSYDGFRADWTRREFSDNGGEADVMSLSYIRRF
ncbi:porin family protein [Brevundimonas lenta]|uniref:Outer membrane protein beta-barrel domain-containing protein n=1 Tax=Brevundimonas lenta TaxID=424796 RepID=A0A7W6JEJ8_9CAUL|nr:porin family protein [Brevundimonas lenta]MBB4083606.1 hypothetical protein [Brevundimonas lenta]